MRKSQKKVVELFFYITILAIGIIAMMSYKPKKIEVHIDDTPTKTEIMEQVEKELKEIERDDFIPIE